MAGLLLYAYSKGRHYLKQIGFQFAPYIRQVNVTLLYLLSDLQAKVIFSVASRMTRPRKTNIRLSDLEIFEMLAVAKETALRVNVPEGSFYLRRAQQALLNANSKTSKKQSVFGAVF